jgi:hypothetical protein
MPYKVLCVFYSILVRILYQQIGSCWHTHKSYTQTHTHTHTHSVTHSRLKKMASRRTTSGPTAGLNPVAGAHIMAKNGAGAGILTGPSARTGANSSSLAAGDGSMSVDGAESLSFIRIFHPEENAAESKGEQEAIILFPDELPVSGVAGMDYNDLVDVLRAWFAPLNVWRSSAVR